MTDRLVTARVVELACASCGETVLALEVDADLLADAITEEQARYLCAPCFAKEAS